MELTLLNTILGGKLLTILIAGSCLGVFGGILGQRTKWLRTIIRFAIYGACEVFLMKAGIFAMPVMYLGTYALGSGIGYLLAALVKSTGKKKKKKDK